MKQEVERLRSMIKRNWEGPMWHGSSLKDALDGIDHQKAFRKPALGAHNIYELVMHLICWRRFTIEHLKGNADYKIEINSEADWITKYEPTDAAWKDALATLQATQQELEQLMDGFEETKLDDEMHGRKFSWYVLLHGVVQHDIYHSAQINLLKK